MPGADGAGGLVQGDEIAEGIRELLPDAVPDNDPGSRREGLEQANRS